MFSAGAVADVTEVAPGDYGPDAAWRTARGDFHFASDTRLTVENDTALNDFIDTSKHYWKRTESGRLVRVNPVYWHNLDIDPNAALTLKAVGTGSEPGHVKQLAALAAEGCSSSDCRKSPFLVQGGTLSLQAETRPTRTSRSGVYGLYFSDRLQPLLLNNRKTEISLNINGPEAGSAQYSGAGFYADIGTVSRASSDLSIDINASGVLPRSFSGIRLNNVSEADFGGAVAVKARSSALSYGSQMHTISGVYAQGRGPVMRGPSVSIDLENTAGASLNGFYLQANGSGDFEHAKTVVTSDVETLSVRVKGKAGEGQTLSGIQAWRLHTFLSEARRTVVSTEALTGDTSVYDNTAAYASGGSSIEILGGEAVLSSKGTANGGAVLQTDDFLGGNQQGGTVTVNAAKVTLVSEASETDDPLKVTAALAGRSGRIYVNSSGDGADQGGTVRATGRLLAYSSGKIDVNFTGTDSVFTGASRLDFEDDVDVTVRKDSEVNVGLRSGARWNMTASSEVSTLRAGGGSVYLGTEPAYFADASGAVSLSPVERDFEPVMLYAHRLSGENESFYLRAAIDEDRADTIYLDSGTGSHKLFVRSQGAEPSVMAMNQYLVHQESGDASFSLGNAEGFVDAGVYVYALAERQTAADSGDGQATEWYLKRTERPDVPDNPDEPPLSPAAETVLVLHGAAAQTADWVGSLEDLRKRLGDVRHQGRADGLWAQLVTNRTQLSGYRGGVLRQDAFRANFGADRKVSDEWLLGGNLLVIRGRQKMRHSWDTSTGVSKTEGLRLYATKCAPTGVYLDIVGSIDRHHQSMNTKMLDGTPVSGRYSNWGLGLSLEAGHHSFHGDKDGYFLEPQLQLAYYRAGSANYRLSSGMDVHQDSADSLTGRAGLLWGKRLLEEDGTFVGDLYLKGGLIHEFLGDQKVRLNSERFDLDGLGTRWYYGFGGERYISRRGDESAKIYGQFERVEGHRFTTEYEFRLGLKFCF